MRRPGDYAAAFASAGTGSRGQRVGVVESHSATVRRRVGSLLLETKHTLRDNGHTVAMTIENS